MERTEKAMIAIVEDSEGIRQQWERLVASTPGMRCVCACATGEEAIRRLPQLRPDAVLMDINLPGMSGIDCTRELKTLLPDTQILMVTAHNDTDLVFQALEVGASGYLLKRTTPPELRKAMIEVLGGGAPMSGEIARKVIETFRRPQTPKAKLVELTQREHEILEQVSRGFSNKEIADRLGISFDTVRTHLRHIYEKLHVRCRAEAVARHMAEGRSLVSA